MSSRSRTMGGTSEGNSGTGAVAIYPLLLRYLRPEALICATELDETSVKHAQTTLRANSVPESSIQVMRAPNALEKDGRILFPLFEADPPNAFDLTVCNPPFFASEEEMQRGADLKAEQAHAAGTAAANELITPGGEVAFVRQMMVDSLDAAALQAERGARHAWYTSLIGKYASLQPLVHFLKERCVSPGNASPKPSTTEQNAHASQVNNYFVKTIRQARTSRWILGWSFSPVRLPDSLTRPDVLVPGTSFAHLLPPATTISHTPVPPVNSAALRERVITVLHTIDMPVEWDNSSEGASAAVLVPVLITWSRAARRQAQRAKAAEGNALGTPESPTQGSQASPEPLFIARLSFEAQTHPTDAKGGGMALANGATLHLEWLQGKDRQAVDAFWKFLLTKAELLGAALAPSQGRSHAVPYPAKRSRVS